MANVSDIAEALVPTVKLVLRLSGDALDAEATMLASSAVADMLRVGVDEACMEEGGEFWPIVQTAASLYAKAHFGMDNPNEEMRFWRESYLMHVDMLLNSKANSHAGEPE